MVIQRPGIKILQLDQLGAIQIRHGVRSGPSTVTLNPSGNTFIVNSVPNTNYGNSVELDVGENKNIPNSVRRSLIQFNLSSLAGHTLLSATLRLTLAYAGSDYAANNRTLQAYRIRSRDWVTLQATWNIYKTGSSWTAAGCSDTSLDREATAIGSAALQMTDAAGSTHDFVLTPGAGGVQDWVDGILANNGLVLIADTEVNDLYAFASSRHATVGYRPKLIVTYQ